MSCDVHLKDVWGNPTLKYCFLSPIQPSDKVYHTGDIEKGPNLSTVFFCLESLLNHGADLAAEDAEGNHALLWSVGGGVVRIEFGHTTIEMINSTHVSDDVLIVLTEKLLLYGEVLTKANKTGATILDFASEAGNTKLIYYLMCKELGCEHDISR
jgi:ankyrin repeat protein